MPAKGSAVDQLRGHLHSLIQLLKTDQELWAVMGELVLRAPRDAELAQIFRQTDGFWHRTLRELIEQAIHEGAITPALDAEGMASLMIVAIKGLSLPTVVGFQPEAADRIFELFEQLLGFQSQERPQKGQLLK
jgi:transcriptional regulator BetI-like protein